MEELMAFAGKEGIELPDELLDSVAGGLTKKEFLNFVWVNKDRYDRYF